MLGRISWRRMATRCAMRCSGRSYAIVRARCRPLRLPMRWNMARRPLRCIRFSRFRAGEAPRRKSVRRFSRLRVTSRPLQRCRPCLTRAGSTIGKSLRATSRFTMRQPCARAIWPWAFSQVPKRCSSDVASAPTRLVARCGHCSWATASRLPSAAPSTPLRGPSSATTSKRSWGT